MYRSLDMVNVDGHREVITGMIREHGKATTADNWKLRVEVI